MLVERRLTVSALLVGLISSALGIPTQRLLIDTSAKGGIEPCLEPLVSKEAAHSLNINQLIFQSINLTINQLPNINLKEPFTYLGISMVT